MNKIRKQRGKVSALLACVSIMAVLLSSCIGSSSSNDQSEASAAPSSSIDPLLRPHDQLEPTHAILTYVGYNGTDRTSSYKRYMEEDIKRMKDAGMNEYVLTFIVPIMSYHTDSGELKLIVSSDDIANIPMELTNCKTDADLKVVRKDYSSVSSKYKGVDMCLEYFIDLAVTQTKWFVQNNPDCKLWITLPTVLVQPLADKYIDPLKKMVDGIKANLPQNIWEKSIRGFYWGTEEIAAWNYTKFNANNQVNFDNPMVKAMRALSDKLHSMNKEMMWIPYYRHSSSDDTGRRIGMVANKTDIFDFVLIQPSYYFDNTQDRNISIIDKSTEQNAVLLPTGKIFGNNKISSTKIGFEVEIDSDISQPAKLTQYMAYHDAFVKYKAQSFAFYVGTTEQFLTDAVFNRVSEFFK